MEQMVGSASTQMQQNEVGEKGEIKKGESLERKVEKERGWWWKSPTKEKKGDMGIENTSEAIGEVRWEDTTFDGITGAIGGGGSPGKAVVESAEGRDEEKIRREKKGEEALKKVKSSKFAIRRLLEAKMSSLLDDFDKLNVSDEEH